MGETEHVPVMLDPVINGMHIKKDKTYIDATLGAGGHSLQIIKQGGIVLGIEADSEMIEKAKVILEKACPVGQNDLPDFKYFKIINDNFANIRKICDSAQMGPYYGVLFDLGISNLHYQNKRGFSFNNLDEPLDMRLDPETTGISAAVLLNALRRDQLMELFSKYLRKGESRRMVELILTQREAKPFEKVADLVEVCRKAKIKGKTDPATKPFMALRIAVNSELENLKLGLEGAIEVLSTGGRIVVITFHSGEDRIVKQKMVAFEEQKLGKIITKDPIIPDKEELERNPKSRSAKLRIFEKQ